MADSKTAMHIINLQQLQNEFSTEVFNRINEGIDDIFFKTSGKNFSCETERKDFIGRWLEPYRNYYPQFFLVAVNWELKQVVGYLSGLLDSDDFYRRFPVAAGLCFAQEFKLYPAHFHINCRPEYQGQGVGAKLIASFVELLDKHAIGGVHVVTVKEARNVHFYQKNKFTYQVEAKCSDKVLLFLGKKLDLNHM